MAAHELTNRVAIAGLADHIAPMFVGTIHGYSFRLLQDHVPKHGGYDVRTSATFSRGRRPMHAAKASEPMPLGHGTG